ncbi:hypothetical protein ACQ7HM_16625 [Williamsia sp. MIQD14]|uniref:hypothetical protein n=1 Tax=Williamsia sp. MIQD14 TaxID=3425703 RepID=UPI003DA0D735
MSSIQVADETFVAASPHDAPHVLADRSRWRRWWPDLLLTVVEDRREQGMRWSISGGANGTMEVWIEEVLDGFVLHYFMHAEPAEDGDDLAEGSARRRATRLASANHRRRVAGRAMSTEVKDRLEAGRAAGEPAVGRG